MKYVYLYIDIISMETSTHNHLAYMHFQYTHTDRTTLVCVISRKKSRSNLLICLYENTIG